MIFTMSIDDLLKVVLFWGVILLCYVFSDEIAMAFQIMLWVAGGVLVLFLIRMWKRSSAHRQEAEVRKAEGTQDLSCQAFSRRIASSINARLAETYGPDVAQLVRKAPDVEGSDSEFYMLSGSMMDRLEDETGTRTGIEIRMNSREPRAADLYIWDATASDARRKSSPLWHDRDASIPAASEKLSAAVDVHFKKAAEILGRIDGTGRLDG